MGWGGKTSKRSPGNITITSHSPYQTPRERGKTKTNMHILNKRTKSTYTSSLFTKRGNRIIKKTEKYKNKKHKARQHKSPCRIKKVSPGSDTITNRSPSQTPRGRGNRQIQTSTNRVDVRKALRLALSSSSEVIAILKGLKNTRTKWHMERHTTNRLVE